MCPEGTDPVHTDRQANANSQQVCLFNQLNINLNTRQQTRTQIKVLVDPWGLCWRRVTSWLRSHRPISLSDLIIIFMIIFSIINSFLYESPIISVIDKQKRWDTWQMSRLACELFRDRPAESQRRRGVSELELLVVLWRLTAEVMKTKPRKTSWDF